MSGGISIGVAIAYALAMATMAVFLIGVPITLGKFDFGIVMIVWTSLPVTGLLLLRPRSRKALIISALVILFAIYAYIDMIMLNPDPQSALGMIFVPIYQLALAAAAWGLAALAHRALSKAAK